MEPRPRGILPPGHNNRLGLVNAARENYQGMPRWGINYETTPLHGQDSIDILDRFILPATARPNILVVGLGMITRPLVCSAFETFRIAAHLEGRGIDFEMTLVDFDPEVTADVQARTKLYIRKGDYQHSVFYREAWDKYLSDTRQDGRCITATEEGVILGKYGISHEWWEAEHYLAEGWEVANVPPLFREKLENGQIRVINEDIALADLGTDAFDYAACVNVLYMVPTEGQQLALANIASSLKLGGRALVNDISGRFGFDLWPMLTRFDGWLEISKLRELGLARDHRYGRSTEESEWMLLRKTK